MMGRGCAADDSLLGHDSRAAAGGPVTETHD